MHWQATAGVDLFVNASLVNGTLRQSLAASLSGVSCALTVAEVCGGSAACSAVHALLSARSSPSSYTQSNVGPVHTALLQGAIEALLTDVLVPLLNTVLRAGSRRGEARRRCGGAGPANRLPAGVSHRHLSHMRVLNAAAGLPLPALDGLALANTTIACGSGYSLVATDIVHA